MKRGELRCGSAASTAALNRSRWPTCRMRLRLRRLRDQRPRLFGRLGDRLFHEHVGAGGQEGIGDFEVRGRGRHHADRIHLAEQLAIVGDGLRAHLAGHRVAHLFAPVDHRDELAVRQAARISAHESGRDSRRR